MNKLMKTTLALTTICTMQLYLVGCGKDDTGKSADKMDTPAQVIEPAKPVEEPLSTPETQTAEPAQTEAKTEPAQMESGQATTRMETPGTASTPAGAESKPAPATPDTGHEEMLALARKSGCLACHNIDKKVVGPAWKDVAARYKGNAGARAQLIEKVSKGGRGNWTDVVGNVAMPPYHPRVSTENIGRLVDFVLSLSNS